MLPIEELEDKSFQKILEKAKEKINNIYPMWTNYNPADSGMALLELFAYMAEIQQFHAVQMGESHHLAFLHLLGVHKRGIQPAKVYARISGVEKAFSMPRGTKALAGTVVFETEETTFIERDHLIIGEETLFYPFGEEPSDRVDYEICLRNRLEQRIVHTIYFDIYDNYPVKRNAIDEGFIPLVELQMEYYDGEKYRKCEIINDTTCGLLQSGILQFCFSGEMGEKDGNYRVRVTVQGEYDTAPLLQGIYFNMVSFIQKETILEYQEYTLLIGEKGFYEITAESWNVLQGDTRVYIKTEKGYRETKKFAFYDREEKRNFVFAKEIFDGLSGEVTIRLVSGSRARRADTYRYEGTGMPNQQFFLPERNVLGSDFELWISEDKNEGCYTPWFRVTDFAQAGNTDRCYVLEEEKGIIKFGNGRQGIMPKGNIEIISCAVSAGDGGNIQKNQMERFDREVRAKELYNPDNAMGGKNTESLDSCFDRYEKDMKLKSRAVTYKDYEEIIKRTPGLRIKKAKVFASDTKENTLEAVIQPFTNRHRILKSDVYDKNVMRVLEKTKMLGTHVIIKKTEYIGVSIRLEAGVKSQYMDVKARIEEHIREYFEMHMDFGKAIVYSRIFGFIDSLPETDGISELTIYAKGKNVMRDDNKDIYLPFNGMAYLEEVQIRCIRTNA